MGETTRLVFRKMTGADVTAVAALDRQCFGERDAWSRADFFYAAKYPHCKFIVAELDGKIVACAGVEFFSDGAEIQSLAVAPKFRCQGIGRRLLMMLLDAVQSRGLSTVILEVRPSNTAAIKLYEDFGFQVVDRLKNFYLDEDALVMLRDL